MVFLFEKGWKNICLKVVKKSTEGKQQLHGHKKFKHCWSCGACWSVWGGSASRSDGRVYAAVSCSTPDGVRRKSTSPVPGVEGEMF